MATKHQLEQQLDEIRADLEAANERLSEALLDGDKARRERREASAALEKAELLAKQEHQRARYLEVDVARLGGMLDGMREVLTSIGIFGKGDAPPREGGNPFANIGESFSDIARGLGR